MVLPEGRIMNWQKIELWATLLRHVGRLMLLIPFLLLGIALFIALTVAFVETVVK